MTNKEIYELLVRIENGKKEYYNELWKLYAVKEIRWGINVKQLPKSIALLNKVTSVSLSGSRFLSDISALSYLTGLTNLDLSGTSVSDISALSNLTKLTNLDLSRTNISDLESLSNLTRLTNLNLSGTSVRDISALSNLMELTNLDLSGTNVSNLSALPNLTRLIKLDLSGTSVHDIRELSNLTRLTNLDLSGTSVCDISALSNLMELTNLNLSRTNVSDISALSNLTGLTNLDLSGTSVSDISALSNLTKLTNLDLSLNKKLSDISALSDLTILTYLHLSGTSVHDIRELSNLTRLFHIDLRYLNLNAIPEWVIDRSLEFLQKPSIKLHIGVFIEGLQLNEQPIEIFSQNHKLIREYYRSQAKVPINECKVIFLGDAEAGKTHSIKRLLQKGEKLTDFDGNSTPGIEITVSSSVIEDTAIFVNYWDFGGQEIQHSMHRMFLTERTVYVVFLNARQDPLDEKARYWIENINSFAAGAPILLVINKIDQNDRPKFNEDGIRAAYKEQIKDIVRMSALNDEKEVFLEELQGNINRIINELLSTNQMIPKSWKTLMGKIRTMSDHYLTTKEFREKCFDCNVTNYKNIHNNLVDLFQVIGVSFCYYKKQSYCGLYAS